MAAVGAEKDVVSIGPAGHYSDFPQDGQFTLHRPQRQLTFARDLPYIHLSRRVMKQRAQDLSSHEGKEQI